LKNRKNPFELTLSRPLSFGESKAGFYREIKNVTTPGTSAKLARRRLIMDKEAASPEGRPVKCP